MTKNTGTKVEEKVEEIELTKEPVPVAVKKNGAPEPPDGYIHWSDVDKEYPKFSADYAGRHDVMVSIWVDEKAPLKAILPSVCRKASTGSDGLSNSLEATPISEIPNQREFPISVTDLLALMGEPGFHLDALRRPESATTINDAYWKSARQNCLRKWRRDSLGEPKMVTDKFGRQVLKMGSYSDDTCCIKANNEHGYWDKMPNLYLVTPDKLTMTTTAVLDIVDFTIQSMEESGISLTKNHFTQTEKDTIKQCLISKAREYQIEGLLKSDTIAMAVVQANMTAAVEKHTKQR